MLRKTTTLIALIFKRANRDNFSPRQTRFIIRVAIPTQDDLIENVMKIALTKDLEQ